MLTLPLFTRFETTVGYERFFYDANGDFHIQPFSEGLTRYTLSVTRGF